MKNKAVKIGIIASILPHLFCCVLPIVLSLLSLFMPVEAHWHIIPHNFEPVLFTFSAIMLLFSWYLVLKDCKCDCDHCKGKDNHKAQKIILCVITALFIISIILHIFAHH